MSAKLCANLALVHYDSLSFSVGSGKQTFLRSSRRTMFHVLHVNFVGSLVDGGVFDNASLPMCLHSSRFVFPLIQDWTQCGDLFHT